MSTLPLELIVYSAAYVPGTKKVLPIRAHVHKRIERFIYAPRIREEATPIVYIENQDVDSRRNLQIANRTYSVITNSLASTAHRAIFYTFFGSTYTGPYRSILATDVSFVDERGGVRPLFYRHTLPADTVECNLYVIASGNKHNIDTGYVVDLDQLGIYTNYQNVFDEQTGAYKLFFVVSTDSNGVATHKLLNPEPATREADWFDIDPSTGGLVETYPLYTKAYGSGGWTFYFNRNSKWFIKPIDSSLIQPRMPAGTEPAEDWFMRFSNGDVTAVVNGSARRYYVPEYEVQPFVPTKPYVFSPYTRLIPVNKNIVVATRKNIRIDPANGLHIELFIEDTEHRVIRALTTNQALAGTRWSSTDVFYEADKIVYWDNVGGFIGLSIDLLGSWSYYGNYYYNADDYEYRLLSLNPVANRDCYNNTYVFYLIPDVDSTDYAIHHLVVNSNGVIVECSQGPGAIGYHNIQLLDSLGAYNSDTVIGLKYISETDPDTFMTRYGAGYANAYGYMVLAEVAVLDLALREDQLTIDARRVGAVPYPEEFENVIRANPRILQSYAGYGPQGQVVPENAVVVANVPVDILEDYGGKLTEEEAERLIRSGIAVTSHVVIQWDYPKVELTGWSDAVGQVRLEWTWEGEYDYKLYRRDNVTDAYTLIYTEVAPVEGTIVYNDVTVLSNQVYHYAVAVDGDYEYPVSNSLSVRVS